MHVYCFQLFYSLIMRLLLFSVKFTLTALENRISNLLIRNSYAKTCLVPLKIEKKLDINMEDSVSYWKGLYFKVYSENRQLRLELESLKQEFNDVQSKYKSIKTQRLTESLSVPKKELKICNSADIAHIEVMAHTIIAPGYDISQQNNPTLKGSFRFAPCSSAKRPVPEVPEEIPETLDPDLNPDMFLFEELFILSVSSNFKTSSVKGRYPNATDM